MLSEGGPSLEEAHLEEQVRRALDPAAQPVDRARAVRWLSAFGGDEALRVLERIVMDPEYGALRRVAVVALGPMAEPDAGGILERLVHEQAEDGASFDPLLRVSILEALALRGSDQARAQLRATVLDENAIGREDAARALVLTGAEAATACLLEGFEAGSLDAVVVMDALADAPWYTSDAFFRRFIGDPEQPLELRVEAVDRLSEVDGAAAALLAEFAVSAPDPEMRAEAYRALAFRLDDELMPGATSHLLAEQNPDVRERIHDYLTLRIGQPGEAAAHAPILERMLNEEATGPRLAAARFLAQLTKTAEGERYGYTPVFESQMLPWLIESATSAPSLSERRHSMDVLGLSGLPAARKTLEDLSRSADQDAARIAQEALIMGLWDRP